MRQDKKNIVSNREIAHLLRSVAAAHLIKNKNRFRIIAYENAADSIEHLNREIKDIWQEGKLDTVPHIGKTIADGLDEYFRKGYSTHFKSLFKGIPSTVFILMDVPSIGPKKAYKLVKEFHLTNESTVIEDLKKICLAGKIAVLPTFGEKSQQAILHALELYEKRQSSFSRRMPLPYAYALAEEIIIYLKKLSVVKKANALGSLRRMVTTIGDIDIAVATNTKKSAEIIKHFLAFPRKISVDNAGEKKASIIVTPGIRVDLRVQDIDNYGPMLQYFTGSKAHNVKLREYALKKGLSLSEYGIKTVKGGALMKFRTEEEFYRFLGLQYPPPEIREGTDEIEIAKKHELPKLVELKDIKGDLHLHSNYDLKPSHDLGENNYVEILKRAKQLEYEYLGFSDHNPKMSGLSEEEIIKIMKKRKELIERTCSTKANGISYFIGLEVDILPSGELALPSGAFKYIDYLIISIHSLFRLDVKTMTKRVIKALDHPKVRILAHPTGRLIGKREGYELEWDTIFEACKKKDIAVEINAWPERLDLPDTLVRDALEHGVKFCIDTDAHANFHMDNMKYGVAVARRGWAEKHDIINALDKKQFRNWLLKEV